MCHVFETGYKHVACNTIGEKDLSTGDIDFLEWRVSAGKLMCSKEVVNILMEVG